MKHLKGIRRTVPPRLTQSSSRAEIDLELEAHLDQLVAALQAEGMEPEDAWREARRRFGDVGDIRRRIRRIDAAREGEMRSRELWDSLRQDLRYAFRQLRKSPGLAVVAIFTLALGIGLTTAMFTVVRGVLLKPLPFVDPDRLVAVGVQTPDEAAGDPYVRDAHYEDIERSVASFSGVAGYMTYPASTLTGAGDAARLTPAYVTPGFFDVLGVQPVFGSGFGPAGDGSASSSVVILSDALWRSRFAADPRVLQQTATLDGVSRTIVGVMPPGFDYPGHTDLWLPLDANPMHDQGLSFAYTVVARLQYSVSPEQARSELEALASASDWRLGPGGATPAVRVLALKEVIVGDSRYPLVLFTGSVVLVLLIACTNVANLLLMRAGARQPEIGLRKMLGAGRRRLLRQLLTESVVLALMGGVLGILVAELGVRALLALAPAGTIPRGQEVGIDLSVLGFTLVISLVTGVAFGLAPALQAGRRDLRDAIGASRTHTRARSLARNALVIAELGLAVVLLTGAGLLVRSFEQIRAIDVGFDAAHTLSLYVDLPESSYGAVGPALALHRRVLEGLAAIPGVEGAGAANFEPFGPLALSTRVTTEDAPGQQSGAGVIIASPGYFRAMGIPLRSGRGFTLDDDPDAPGVIVVSRSMAERLWPGKDAVGQRLSARKDEFLTVVGVAEDAVRHEVTEERSSLMYVPLAQASYARQLSHMSYVVRTERSARTIAPAMRAVVREADPNLPVGSVSSMDELVLASLGDRLFQTRVLGLFAVLSMLLAAVGVYGVISHTVTERRRELGIRMALGARADQVASLTLRDVLKLVVPGLLLGGVVAAVTSSLIASALYDVTPRDPVTFAGVALLLGGAAIVAALIPVRRATRVDPMEVLGE